MGVVVDAKPRPPYPRERPGSHCIGVWVGPRAKNLSTTGTRSPDRLARSSCYTDRAMPAHPGASHKIESLISQGIKSLNISCPIPVCRCPNLWAKTETYCE
jgi:hypothetical protein